MEYSATNRLQVGNKSIVAAAQEACRQHLVSPRQGVLSARHADGETILITPADVSLEELGPEKVCFVGQAGELVNGPEGIKVPDELELHLKAYRDRSDVNGIAHLHPPSACVFADRGELFSLPPHEVRQQVGDFIRVICRECPSRYTGLCACWNDIRQSASGAGALLLKEDGILGLADDLQKAVRTVALIEQAAREIIDSSP
jgi:ribulose-5-phosphate 4-epimerase/fuculose-1-phosphate aldolase